MNLNAVALMLDLATIKDATIIPSELRYAGVSTPQYSSDVKCEWHSTPVGLPFTVEFHHNTMNIGIKVKRPCTVTLPDGKEVETFGWREYSVVRDGEMAVPFLPLLLKPSDVVELSLNHTVTFNDASVYGDGLCHRYDVTTSDACKGAWTYSVDTLRYNTHTEIKTKVLLKAIEAQLPDTPATLELYKQYGLTDNGFNPIGREASVHVPHRVLAVKIVGCNTIPSWNEYLKRKTKDMDMEGAMWREFARCEKMVAQYSVDALVNLKRKTELIIGDLGRSLFKLKASALSQNGDGVLASEIVPFNGVELEHNYIIETK